MKDDYLLKKWLKADLNEEEAKAFEALDDAEFYREISEEAARFKADQQVQTPSFETIEGHLKTPKQKINWSRLAVSVAAVLAVAFGLFTLLKQDDLKSYSTAVAQSEHIVLPDASVVQLNELSSLKYNATTWKKDRSLSLDGEAFFHVEKGQRFEVNTPQGTVSVLGTRFNVKARANVFTVTCYEGLVQVDRKEQQLKVHAGSQITFTVEELNQNSVRVAEPFWIKNMSVFDNAPLTAVIKELEDQFNVQINYNSNKELYFTGAFEHKNLENALKSVAQPLNLNYRISNKQVTLINSEN